MPVRSQLSLYVPQSSAADIEAVRRSVDPVQSRLIPAHVTLCREDELAGLEFGVLEQRLRHGRPSALTLHFGPPERFGGHGMLLPSIGDTTGFDALRALVLGIPSPRQHTPHLTLAHPRNPRAEANSLGSAAPLRDGRSVTFDAVQLIEQVDAAPWVVLETFPLLA
jgi:2'-5' RNA ligase